MMNQRSERKIIRYANWIRTFAKESKNIDLDTNLRNSWFFTEPKYS